MAKPKREIIPAAECLLIGGGQSHLEAVRRYAKLSPRPYRLTLVTKGCSLVYSGMLPGLIAGIYRQDEAQIDLGHLCNRSGVRFINAEVQSLDLEHRLAHLADGRSLSFDALSLDIGRYPNFEELKGDRHQLVTVKPVPDFLKLVLKIEQRAETFQPATPLQVVVYGSDMAAIEMALSLAYRFNNSTRTLGKVRISLITRLEDVVPNELARWRVQIKSQLAKLKVAVITGAKIVTLSEQSLKLSDGSHIASRDVLWMQCDLGAEFVRASGLTVTDQGLITVNENLESVSHDGVYAAGDTADLGQHLPISLTGPLSFRLGSVLADNFRRRFLGMPQLGFTARNPAKYFYACGGRSAIGSWYGLSFNLGRCFALKDEQDRALVQEYQCLPVTARYATFLESGNLTEDPCAGISTRIPWSDKETLCGKPREPVGVKHKNLSSSDFLRGFTTDLHRFGYLSMIHGLTHIVGQRTKPTEANIFISSEFAPKLAMCRDLQMVADGARKALQAFGIDDVSEYFWGSWEIGFGCHLRGEPLGTSGSGFAPGDCLILTKPLGTGILMAGHRRHLVASRHLETAFHIMGKNPRPLLELVASDHVLQSFSVGAFGLAHDLVEVVKDRGLSATINLDCLPVYPGTLKALNAGVRSSLHVQNRMQFSQSLHGLQSRHLVLAEMTFDPQTAGGLVLVTKQAQSENLLQKLRQAGFIEAQVIGSISEVRDPDTPPIIFRADT